MTSIEKELGRASLYEAKKDELNPDLLCESIDILKIHERRSEDYDKALSLCIKPRLLKDI